MKLRCAWVVAALAALAQTPDYRIRPRYERSVPLEQVFAKADARQDTWTGEKDYEEIHARLELLAEAARKGEAAFPALDAARRRFTRLEVVQLKVISSSRAGTQTPIAELRLRVELAGLAGGGSRVSLQGHWSTRWRNQSGAWKLDSVDAPPLGEIRGDSLRFTDITDQFLGGTAAWKHQLSRGTDHWRGIMDESTGVDVYGHNGVSVGDIDGDGAEEIYVLQPSALPNRLFRGGTEIAAQAGLDLLDDTRSALFADIDNDGSQDLIAITAARPLLFRNRAGRFSLEPHSGLEIPAAKSGSLTSAAMADYDNDGDLDLYVCSYDFWQPGRRYNSPAPYYDATSGPPNFLFRNDGKGRFEDVTASAGLMHNNDRYSFAAAWGDYDNDGWIDLYVANDFGRNNLYRNLGNGTFRDVARPAGVEDPGAGMSAAWGDYDNDGDLDLYVGNMWSSAGQRVTGNAQFGSIAPDAESRAAFQRQARGNTLFRNNGDGTFADVTAEAGVGMGRWAWSSSFADLDNDGLLDIYVQNGYITGANVHDL
jgi:hypothetical protein